MAGGKNSLNGLAGGGAQLFLLPHSNINAHILFYCFWMGEFGGWVDFRQRWESTNILYSVKVQVLVKKMTLVEIKVHIEIITQVKSKKYRL